MKRKIFTDINKSKLKVSSWNKDILLQIEIQGANGVNYYMTNEDVDKFIEELKILREKIKTENKQ